MRYFSRFLSLLLSLVTTHASSQNAPNCESLYRAAYIEYSKTQRESLNDARLIYQIYFDHQLNLNDAFLAAKPIFQAIDVPEENEVLVLEEISTQMKSGGLCANGKIKPMAKVIEHLRNRNF